ncbi:NAD(P)/FAD-dependent oxidoreductase [Pirellulimonas nuda]|nr:NAD(P)/FAD-dependent oxidoreductase [Pirellulimonas nuda]
MPSTPPAPAAPLDCVVVGASFAGLACATVLARAGLRVRVVERKADPGDGLHTTGIIVKDAVEQVALLDALPPQLTRRVPGVRLYAPNMRHVDLDAPGYYFLTTDTPGVIRWLAEQARTAGAEVVCQTPFTGAQRVQSGFELAGIGQTRFLVGADGPNSNVARALGLGQNRRFLFGMEYEVAGATIDAPDRLHCLLDRRLAPGYIGWMVPGVDVLQVGLARRMRPDQQAIRPVMDAFLQKLAPVCDLRPLIDDASNPPGIRAGLIPCGGVVRPVATERALLVGDAAGMVSPVTAGGIHTALKHGLAAGHAIADFLTGKREDPSRWFVDSYPKFRSKRLLRWLFDHFQSDTAFNLLLATAPMRAAASRVYFHRKGVFNPPARGTKPT